MLQSELDTLFKDSGSECEEECVSDVKSKSKGKGKQVKQAKQVKTKQSKQAKIKQPKIRTTQLIKTSPNNESKWLNNIKQLCGKLASEYDESKLRIVVAYGNTGLLAYWFKTFLPNATVILNDDANIVNKLDEEVKQTCLDSIGVEVVHKDIDEYLIPFADDYVTIIVLNPREFNIKVLEFMMHKLNLIVIGSTKNKNCDYIHIFNNLIAKCNPTYNNICYNSPNIMFATECDYMLCDVTNKAKDDVKEDVKDN